VHAGEAARIFTGGVVPPGADTIVIQENSSWRTASAVVVNKPELCRTAYPPRRPRFQRGPGAAAARQALTDRDRDAGLRP
jgi:molybdopterin molybdotransferase